MDYVCFIKLSIVRCLGYMVERREKGLSLWSAATDAPVANCTVTVGNLTEGSECEFRVSAVNTAGLGEPSVACSAVRVGEKIGE